MDEKQDIDKMKEDILKNYPRMKREDTFNFSCHAGLKCFNQCCADVTIALTPYDILRMKNALDLTSDQFHARYTLIPFNKEQQVPVVILKMNDDEGKTCPFVSEKGCTIYEDRPWACRMYPVGLASPADGHVEEEEFYFIMKDRPCDGLNEPKTWTISEWIENQGIGEYNEMGELFKEVSLHPKLVGGMELDPKKMDMFYIACYDIDKFRDFVFESTFLEKMKIDPDLLEKVKKDDLELLKLAFNWLKFSLFGERTMELKEEIVEFAKKAKQQKNSE